MAGGRRILILDDDKALCAVLAEQLEVDGEFTVVEAANVAEAEARLGHGPLELGAIILDLGLPDRDGADYCIELRQRGLKVPIIMLTSSREELDVVRSFDAGASDCVAKPFRIIELMARLRAHLRSFEKSEDAVFRIGPFIFRPSAKVLHDAVSKKRIRLTHKEAAILKALYGARKKGMTREALITEVWGYDGRAKNHTLDAQVYRLRQKIEIDPQSPRLIVTEPGGYRLNAHGSNIHRA